MLIAPFKSRCYADLRRVYVIVAMLTSLGQHRHGVTSNSTEEA